MSVFIDFETRSVADLKVVGLHNYARHPSTDIWCMSHALDDGPVTTWRPGDPLPDWADGDCEIVAHNAPFEIAIWNAVLAPRYGAPKLSHERFLCTAARAYAMGLPGNLEGACAALKLPVQKDKEGHALMLRMCRPRRMEPQVVFDELGDERIVTMPVWWEDPERIARLVQYCETDVEAERLLYKALFPLSEYETRLWRLDFAINNRGIRIDRPAVQAAVGAVRAAKKDLDAEMARVTGGAVPSCGALAALKEWCASKGVPVAGLAKGDVAEWLDKLATSYNPLATKVGKALALRQEAGKASTAKLEGMLALAGDDDRIRNLFQYHGAATGRWAGRGIQPHNFPRDVPETAQVETMLNMLRGDWRAVDMIYGPVMNVISRCLRGLLVPAEGCVLVGGDFANVESRGAAWFAGEDWKLAAFRAYDAGTGPDLYKLTYHKTFGTPIEEIDKPMRQMGKVEDLSFTYGGGKGAFRTMGGAMAAGMTDTQIDEVKHGWRAAHSATVNVWRALERAACAAVIEPGTAFSAGHPKRAVRFKMVGSFLWCLLPSGRTLCYAYPKVMEGPYGPQLTYFTVPSTNDVKRGTLIDDPANSNKWARVATYGGSLLENVIQAICRDLLADCMLRLAERRIDVVLHVHDEIVAEVSRNYGARGLEIMQREMNTVPAWAEGFPLTAECSIMERYGK